MYQQNKNKKPKVQNEPKIEDPLHVINFHQQEMNFMNGQPFISMSDTGAPPHSSGIIALNHFQGNYPMYSTNFE
jgi:hypothetical protein